MRRLARRADLVYVAEALRVDGAPGRVVPMAIEEPSVVAALSSAAKTISTYKGFQAVSWYGILAPAGTPKPILARLNAEINKALKDPAVRKSIEAEGGEVLGGKAEDFAAYIKAEIATWSPLVKESGAKVD